MTLSSWLTLVAAAVLRTVVGLMLAVFFVLLAALVYYAVERWPAPPREELDAEGRPLGRLRPDWELDPRAARE